jgi:CheY-like chemotaxis protein
MGLNEPMQTIQSNGAEETKATTPIEKLLIVDDHGATREWLRTMLSQTAREICESRNGVEAIDTYADQRPDWVVMDMEMRPMDGLTATRKIKEQFPEARIVIVTNHQAPGFEEVAFEAGATSLFPKEDLWKVHHILENLQARSVATAS